MTKSELIEKLYLNSGLYLSVEDVTAAVSCIINEMTTALGEGGRVEIRGFGAFSLHHRDARMGRNPKTGEAVELMEKYVVHFRPGKALRERVNDSFIRQQAS